MQFTRQFNMNELEDKGQNFTNETKNMNYFSLAKET